jgi:hypothetical protein
MRRRKRARKLSRHRKRGDRDINEEKSNENRELIRRNVGGHSCRNWEQDEKNVEIFN